MSSSFKLFEPFKVGNVETQHRVVMAPLTRMKSTEKTHIPHAELMKEYYAQRASAPGTLIIGEATIIKQKAGTFLNAPGIWSQEQIDAWKIVGSSFTITNLSESSYHLRSPTPFITRRASSFPSFGRSGVRRTILLRVPKIPPLNTSLRLQLS